MDEDPNLPPCFDFYPGRFISATAGMHPMAMGIFMRLLCHQWLHGSIPRDMRSVARITGCTVDDIDEHIGNVRKRFERRVDGTEVEPHLEKTRELALQGKKKQATRKKPPKFDPMAMELPFKSKQFAEAWGDFCRMRSEKGKPVKPTGAKANLKRLGGWDEGRAIAALEYTTANEWQGIREETEGRPGEPARPVSKPIQPLSILEYRKAE